MNRRCLSLLLALCLAPLCAACGSSAQLGAQEQPQQARFRSLPDPLKEAGRAAELPALPPDSAVGSAQLALRRASQPLQLVLRGSEIADISKLWQYPYTGPWEIDTSRYKLSLLPQPGQLSWAVYAFRNLLPEDQANMLTVDISGKLPSRYYIGLADYDSGRWQLHSITRSQGRDVLPLSAPDGSPLQPLSPDGSLYVMVASYDSVQLDIDRLELSLDTPLPPPAGLTVVQAPGVNNFEISWQEPDFPYDAVEVERRSSFLGWDNYSFTVAAGSSSVIDHAVSPSGTDIVPPGGLISYRLRTIVGGRSGPPCAPVDLYRQPEDASDLSASSDMPFSVTLNWNPGGSQGALIFRDSLETPIDDIFGASSWTDDAVPDHEDHQYWIRPYIVLPWLEGTPPVYLPTLGPVTGTLRKRPYITWVSLSDAQSGQSLSAGATVYGAGSYSYAWDFDGATTPESSPDAQPTVSCGPPGYTRGSVTVTNAHGSDVYFFDLLITAGPRPWMQFKYDAGNTGYVPWAGTSVGEELWVYATGAAINGDAVLGLDGTLYAANVAGELHAVNPDGSRKWMLDLGAQILSAPLVAPSGDIFVASDALYCVAPDGSLRWSNPEGKGGYGGHPKILPDGSIACEGQIISPTGQMLGSFKAGSRFAGGKLISPEGRLLTGGSQMRCYDEVQRALWLYVPGTNDSVPSLRSDGAVLVGSYEGLLHCINADGEKVWDYDAGFFHSIYGSPACAPDGTIAFGAYDHCVVLEGDGSLRWSLPVQGEVWAGPAIDAEGKIYFCTYHDGLVLCNQASGSAVWSLDIGSFITASPCIGLDGTVYACNRAGEVWAIGDAP
ncbi:PQQ-binding-like beta-propeller repeat protein [bacterium]|nr:PQQ-binding-like beta-propeller repeat protein [bacterium]